MAIWTVLFQAQDRMEQFAPTTEEVEAASFREALAKIIDDHGYSLDEDEVETMDEGALLQHLEQSNGDGCDFVSEIFEGRMPKRVWAFESGKEDDDKG